MTSETKRKAGIHWGRITRDGLWSNNVTLSQLLALCPTLAVTGTATNGLGMGLATTAVLTISNVLVSAIRNLVTPEVRIPVYIVLIATLVTLVDLGLNAYAHELHKVLGLFIALIVVNCAILGRAESFASKNPVGASALDGLMMGLGFTAVLVVLGGVREIIGTGTLFAGASLLLGQSMAFLELRLIPEYRGFLIAILPPGGFLALGFLLAGKRVMDARMAAVAKPVGEPATASG
ncbi:electron transport complex subunit E [Thiocystis violacea]|uniref:electron transport complex subunit E n=1 Tax=Thiocystis violacea TaxID=13725 RepID=UPI001904FB9A|nr:electron transport complex subunit E [Thiocystis violacea]MBK1718906.1 electron transport complex subunit RsxE [Thiocystis violacea]